MAKTSLQDFMLTNLRQEVWHLHLAGSQRLLKGRETQLIQVTSETSKVRKLSDHGFPKKRKRRTSRFLQTISEEGNSGNMVSNGTNQELVLPELSPGPVSLVGGLPATSGEFPRVLSRERSRSNEGERRRMRSSEAKREAEEAILDSVEESKDVFFPGLQIANSDTDSGSLGASTTRRGLGKLKRRRKTRAGSKFRRLAHFLTILFGLWKVHARRVKHFMDTNIDLMEIEEPQGLMFDVTEFRADKQAKISQDTIRILRKRPSERTTEEVRYIQIALGNYQSIAEYPIRMQKLMAERCWYEEYDAKRVIIRQGHVAKCFYFILSGTVLVSKVEDDSGISRNVCFLRRDESFGELGIMNASQRRATVISKEPVELLVFDDEDFIDIFMSGGLGNPNDDFLSGLHYLNGWPLEQLANNPTNALLSYFKRGAVLMHDSHYCDWLFIVKTGSCLVLKKLIKAEPRKRDTFQQHEEDADSDSLHEELLDQNFAVAEAEAASKMKLKLRQQQLREFGFGIDLYSLKDEEEMNFNADDFCTLANENFDDVTPGSPSIPYQEHEGGTEQSVGKYPGQPLASSGPFLQRTEKPSHEPVSSQAEAEDPFETEQEEDTKHKMDSLKARLERIRKNRNLKMDKHTLVDELNERFAKAKSAKEIKETEADTNPMFVKVRTLVRGDIFGLSDIVHEDQPSFSLVSNGAECVLIKKQFYLEHASPKLMMDLRKEVSPYPDEETLQGALQIHVDWEVSKKLVLRNVLLWNKISKTDVDDARSTIPRPPN